METGLTRGIGHIISSFSVICREREDRRRSCGGDSMEERGILSREGESLAERNVWTEGVRSWWAGGFAGARFPRGLPQLPRPAIIRLSGATISVNVLDSELGSPSKAN